MHAAKHPLAGKTVRIKAHVKHPQTDKFGGEEFQLEDWWDRLGRKSWRDCQGNPACMVYSARVMRSSPQLPFNDEVVYGKMRGLGHLVHVSELCEAPAEVVAGGDA